MFYVDIPQADLDDLKARLGRIRWPSEVEGAGWDYGTNLDYLKSFTEYWQTRYNWREQEARLNRFAHFRAEIDGFGLHFVHERGKGPNPLPLLLTHGWPDSFYRFYKLIPLLTDPAKYGGDPADSFDVIVPSMPGYGFSDRPTKSGIGGQRIAELFVRLMTETLGYEKFAAHGGDIGSGVTEWLAYQHATSLVGIHLTDLPYEYLFTMPQEDLSEDERKYLEQGQAWQRQEGAYDLLQGTKPQTLAYGLNDSPVGLAAWIVEKFRAWSDCDGEVETRFSKDELLTNITLYWLTGTIGTSFFPYFEGQHSSAKDASQYTDVPTGVAIFPKDIVPAPKEFGEHFFNIQRWTEMPRGGHFAALEEPELLAEDLRAFFQKYRATS